MTYRSAPFSMTLTTLTQISRSHQYLTLNISVTVEDRHNLQWLSYVAWVQAARPDHLCQVYSSVCFEIKFSGRHRGFQAGQDGGGDTAPSLNYCAPPPPLTISKFLPVLVFYFDM